MALLFFPYLYAQDEIARIRKRKHGRNMLNRSGNTTDNLCFRYRFRDVFSRFRCCVYNGTGPLFVHVKHNGNMELHVSATFQKYGNMWFRPVTVFFFFGGGGKKNVSKEEKRQRGLIFFTRCNGNDPMNLHGGNFWCALLKLAGNFQSLVLVTGFHLTKKSKFPIYVSLNIMFPENQLRLNMFDIAL